MAKGIRNIRLSFGETGLTHFAGMLLFQRFCRKLDMRRLLQRYVPWQRQARLYQPAEMVLALIYSMVARIRRIYDTEILHYNGCFRSILGLKNFPKPSTLREFLKDITPKELQGIIRIHDLLRRKMLVSSKPPTSLIFDLDSTVLPVFGWKIEEARIGYNPKKPRTTQLSTFDLFRSAQQRYLASPLVMRRLSENRGRFYFAGSPG
jgi:hypothetical protein